MGAETGQMTISQKFHAVPGQVYSLSFDSWARRPGKGIKDNKVVVSLDNGTFVGGGSSVAFNAAEGEAARQYIFRAGGTGSTADVIPKLKDDSQMDDTFGPYLDNVSVRPLVVDIDTDSNNDGSIDPVNGAAGTDDPIERNVPGRIIRYGVGRAETKLDADLAGIDGDKFYAYLYQSGGDGAIKVYDAQEGGNEIPMGTMLTLGSSGISPDTVWVEGTDVGPAELSLLLKTQSGEEFIDDAVRYGVYDPTADLQVTGFCGEVVPPDKEDDPGALLLVNPAVPNTLTFGPVDPSAIGGHFTLDAGANVTFSWDPEGTNVPPLMELESQAVWVSIVPNGGRFHE